MSGVVPVVQSDRVCAVAIMADRWNTFHEAKVLNGKADHWVPVQEAARHRIAETARLEAEIERLRGALEPFVSGANHTMIFLRTRQKINPVGLKLYEEDVERARIALAADTGEG